MGKIEDFAGMTQYAIVDNLFQNTNAVAEKYKDSSGQFDYNAALAPHAQKHSAEFNAVRFTLTGDEDDKSADNVTLINAQKASKTRINHAFMEQVYNQGRYALIMLQRFKRTAVVWDVDRRVESWLAWYLYARRQCEFAGFSHEYRPFHASAAWIHYILLEKHARLRIQCANVLRDA